MSITFIDAFDWKTVANVEVVVHSNCLEVDIFVDYFWKFVLFDNFRSFYRDPNEVFISRFSKASFTFRKSFSMRSAS